MCYRDVRDSIASHRVEDGGNGSVTLVLERVVGEQEPLPFDELPPSQGLEPLKDVSTEENRGTRSIVLEGVGRCCHSTSYHPAKG